MGRHAQRVRETETPLVEARWLSLEPDPHDLLITYPSEAMTMWPISTRVNKPENDDATLLDHGDPFDCVGSADTKGRVAFGTETTA